MTKKEIEQKFEGMLLQKIIAHDMWIIPTVNPPQLLYTFHITYVLEKTEDAPMIRVNGGPLSLQGWYTAENGIERIQIIIQETIDNYDKKRD